MIYWPLEDTFTVVLESKVVEPKDPAIDDAVKVKEGGKVFDGKLAAVGSKVDVEAKLIELERKKNKGSAAITDGELQVHVIHKYVARCVHVCTFVRIENVRHACTCM